MCLHQLQNVQAIQPPAMSMAGASAPDPNMPGGDTGPNSLGNALDASRTPQPAQVQAPTKMGRALELASGGAFDPTGGLDQTPGPTGRMTKFGALAKIFGSMMHGAAVGGVLGKSHPGGGFQAANEFYMQQRMMDMQRYQLAANMMKLQSEVQKNQAEAQWAQRRPMVTRTAPAIKGYDDQGNSVFMSQDPQSGDFKPVEGIHPGSGPYKETNTQEAGKVLYDPANPRAGAIPLTLGPQVGNAADAKNDVAAGSDESASEPSTRAAGNVPRGMFGGQPKQPSAHDSGSPIVPIAGRRAISTSPTASLGAIAASGGGGGGGIPLQLHAPGYSTPKATVRASRNAAGVETDNVFDTNPNSPTFGQRIATTGNTRQPVPDRAAGRGNTRDAQKASDIEDTEQYAATALQKSGGDPDKAVQLLNNLKVADPDAAKKLNRLLPQIRKSIASRAKQLKPKVKPNNPFGMNNDDYQRMVGSQSQPDQDQDQP
jgi:hypothetical protein